MRGCSTTSHGDAAPAPAYAAGDHALLGRLERGLLNRPAARRVLLVLCCAAFAGASVKFIRNIHTTESSEFRGEKRKTALGRWLADPQALVDGENPYGPGHWFPNPPLVLLGLTPLAYVPVSAAAGIWLAAKLAALFGAGACMVRATRRADYTLPIGVLLMAGLFSLRPIMGDVQHGNLNIFVLFELAVVWLLFVRGKDAWAGVFLALAITTKVTPALLLIYFVYKRAWHVVAGCAAGGLLFVVLVPGVILGFERNFELLGGWFNLMVRSYVFEGWITVQGINQSLPGLWMKWFSAPDMIALRWPNASLGAAGAALQSWFPVELTSRVGGRFEGSIFLDVFNQAWDQARLAAVPLRTGMPLMGRPESVWGAALIRGSGLLVLGVLAWVCRSRTTDRSDPRMLLEFSVVLLAMLLLSERTWKHHMVTLFIVYLASWQVVACYAWSRRARVLLVGGLLLQLGLLQARGDILLYVGVITAAVVLALLQNGWMLRRLDRHAAVPPTEPAT